MFSHPRFKSVIARQRHSNHNGNDCRGATCSLVLGLLFASIVSNLAESITTASPVAGNMSSLVTLESADDFDQYLLNFLNDPRQLVLLLDYDGTLAPITTHPNFTIMPPETESALKKLVERNDIFLAIISGRGVEDVRNKVSMDGLIFAGNHGLEISYPNGTTYNYPIPQNLQANFTKLLKVLGDNVSHDNAWVENKKTSLTFHYRETPEELQEQLRAQAEKIIQEYGYLANQAHYAIEAKPPVEWHKGKAALYILESKFGSNWNESVKVLFAGDDTTDEDAMEALKGKGISLRIATDENIDTLADYRLPSPFSIGTLLRWIDENYIR